MVFEAPGPSNVHVWSSQRAFTIPREDTQRKKRSENEDREKEKNEINFGRRRGGVPGRRGGPGIRPSITAQIKKEHGHALRRLCIEHANFYAGLHAGLNTRPHGQPRAACHLTQGRVLDARP